MQEQRRTTRSWRDSSGYFVALLASLSAIPVAADAQVPAPAVPPSAPPTQQVPLAVPAPVTPYGTPYGTPYPPGTYYPPPPPPPVAPVAPEDESALPAPSGGRVRADPAWTEYFWLPTARTLRARDIAMQYIGYLGLLGVRYGVVEDIDIGIGLPYYVLGLTADIRAALVQTDSVAFSFWGMAHMPLLRDVLDGRGPVQAGMMYFAGPLLSFWGDKAGVHLGAQIAGTSLGRVTLVAHGTVEVRMGGAMKIILETVNVFSLNEPFFPCRDAVGSSTVLPHILTGVRLHSRRVAVDVGLLYPLHSCLGVTPPWSDWIAFPVVSIHQLL